jgi:ATP-dependent exoDNAse (exonuclease V) beta subunit
LREVTKQAITHADFSGRSPTGARAQYPFAPIGTRLRRRLTLTSIQHRRHSTEVLQPTRAWLDSGAYRRAVTCADHVIEVEARLLEARLMYVALTRARELVALHAVPVPLQNSPQVL